MKKLASVTVFTLFLLGCGAVLPTTATAHTYVGSANSTVYHYPSCKYAQKIKPDNQVWFADVKGAKDAGYEPCKVCKPPSQ